MKREEVLRNRSSLRVNTILVVSLLFLCTSVVWAAGKCPTCGKAWTQPWAKDFKVCPVCATPLVPIEIKVDDDSEAVRGIRIERVSQRFTNYYRRRVAFCVGINNYPSFPILEYAVKDARSVAGTFKGYDFDEVFLQTDARATKRKIVNELLRFKAEAEENDLFIFYFAGHGTTAKDYKGKEHGYLIPVDAKQKDIGESGISMGLFKDICDTMPNKHILFLVDCCYSGYGLTRNIGVKKFEIGENIQEYLRVITDKIAAQLLTAGGKDDLAHEREGHGIFTSYLLDVLKGKTFHKEDGVISALEMASYIKKKVIQKTKGKQNPAFGYLAGNGDVVFITGHQNREHISLKGLLSLEKIEALYNEAEKLRNSGEYFEAERKMTEAYIHFKKHHSTNTDMQLRYLKTVSYLCLKMQKNDMAEYYSREILVTAQDNLDKRFGYNQLGLALLNKGGYDQAIEYYQKALGINVEKIGPKHLNVAMIYNNLGTAYLHKADYDRAIEYYQKALGIGLKKLGPDHPDVGMLNSDLGMAYARKGDYNQAIEYYQKALGIALNKLGPDHPNVSMLYNNLGNTYAHKGEYDRAIEYYQRALGIGLKKLGPDHPNVGLLYNDLGTAYAHKGEYDRAIEYYQRALGIGLKKLGPDHPYTKAVQKHLDSLNR